MGMYTELIFGAHLKKDTPEHIIKIIQDLANGDPDEVSPFYNSRNVLLGNSGYFPVQHCIFKKDSELKIWSLNSRASIKNYSDEIEFFLEFIKPYISSGSGINDIYAYVLHEEDENPKIYSLT